MTLRSFCLALTAVALVAVVPTAMADTKIAAVKIDKIQENWAGFRTFVDNSTQEFQKRKNALDTQKAQLDSDEEKYKQGGSAQMGPEQRTKTEKSFGDRELDLSSAAKRLQEDYNQRAAEIRRTFEDSTTTAIKQVAVEKGYDVVLPDVPYVNPTLDITDDVLKKLNQVQLPALGTVGPKPTSK